MTPNPNGLTGDRFTRVVIPMMDQAMWRRTGRAVPGLPNGCDYQGRHPQAAEAATDIGADDDSVSPVFDGLLSWPGLLSAATMVGAIAALIFAVMP